MKKLYRRNLDDQAKIFSLSFNKKDTSIFSISTTLKEKIDKELLEKALLISIKKYKLFKVKMKKGFFKYYLEENLKSPVIQNQKNAKFKKINTKDNNEYLFSVTYQNKKINIYFFHILTDGNGGNEFFKDIISNYLELKYPTMYKENSNSLDEIKINTENSYKKCYDFSCKKAYTAPKAYQLKGEELEKGTIDINKFNINLAKLKKYAKEKESSISEFLISMISYCIYKTNYKKNKGKKPINICVPINLKKYFPTETITNFVSHMMISLKFKQNKNYNFEEILSMVKHEFNKKLKKERIIETITANGKAVNNFFVNITPLFLKKLLVILGSFEVKKKFTITLTNLGGINLGDNYSKFINDFSFTLPPDWAEKTRCAVCSFKDKLIINFATKLKEKSFEMKFKELLTEFNIEFELVTN